MLTILARIRKEDGEKARRLRKKGIVPAVLYGPKIKTISLEIDLKEFKKILKEAGETSLISLEVAGEKKKYLVLIHDITKDSLTEEITHVDFYQPELAKEIEVKIPLIFRGEAPAVKNLGGTLVKNIQEIEVKSLPENLPKEIEIDLSSLEALKSHILVKDLPVAAGVKILNHPNDIVVSITEAEKVEEELAKPLEEKIEEVKVAEKEKKEKEKETEEEKSNSSAPREEKPKKEEKPS